MKQPNDHRAPNAGKDLLLDRLVDLAGHIEIVHHIPGRIRLKVKLAGLSAAQEFQASDLMSFNGVLDARTNAAARSIVISYDQRLIPSDLWSRLISAGKDPTLGPAVKEDLTRLLTVKSA